MRCHRQVTQCKTRMMIPSSLRMRQMLAYTPSLSINLRILPSLSNLGNLNREKISEFLSIPEDPIEAKSSKGKEAKTSMMNQVRR